MLLHPPCQRHICLTSRVPLVQPLGLLRAELPNYPLPSITRVLRASFATRANAYGASGLTIAQLLGHANNTQILPTYVKPLDENTKAVINALDAARTSHSVKSPTVQ